MIITLMLYIQGPWHITCESTNRNLPTSHVGSTLNKRVMVGIPTSMIKSCKLDDGKVISFWFESKQNRTD